MLLAISIPAGNERGPLYMDYALAGIHQGNPKRLPLTFELAQHAGEVGLFCRIPPDLCAVVCAHLYAQYPQARVEQLPEESVAPSPGSCTWNASLHLKRDLFPIRRYPQFEDTLNRQLADPLSPLLLTLATDPRGRLSARIQITVRPAPGKRCHQAEQVLRRLAHPFFRAHHRLAEVYQHLAMSHRPLLRVAGWFLGRLARGGDAHRDPLAFSGTRLHDREEDLQAAADKLGRLLFEAEIRLTVTGRPDATAEARPRLREMAGAFGPFSSPRLASFLAGNGHRPFLLSTEELATLFHPPSIAVSVPAMTTVESREFPPPATLPLSTGQKDLAVLGTVSFRTHRLQRFGILPEDRRRHLAVFGKTGMGKSTLLQRLLTSDIASGKGLALVDPHGDLADAVLATVPRVRTNDVILFDAADRAYPLAFNVLDCPYPEHRALLASGVLSAFKKLYGEFWGPRLEHILRNSLLAVMEVPGSTLLTLLRILSDARFRKTILTQVTDPVVRSFWEHEFAAMPAKLQAEAIAPIQNKVGHFVSSPILRRLLCQSENRLRLRAVMDEGMILLVNLSKGKIGDDTSALLGSFLITSLQLAAMSRADQPEAERRDFQLYVDEFQNYATDSFATILSEARKYHLSLTIANQYLAQIDEATLAAVFGNIGTLVCFQVGAHDAEILAEQLGGDVTPQDLLRLPRYAAYVRLLIDGMPSRPFSMATLPPGKQRLNSDRTAIIRRYSRQRYAKPIQWVEHCIRQAFESR